LSHASAYRNPAPYQGKDVLIVAPGNTGSEIAAELSRNGAARVRAAMRSIPYVTKREWLGIPTPLIAVTVDPLPTWLADRNAALFQRIMFGNLKKVGFAPATYGLATSVRDRHVAPVIDAGFIDALKAGQVELVAAVAGFDGADVILADGDRIQPESVIAATGYDRGLEPLVGHLGVLDERGEPSHPGRDGQPDARGLYFVGYETWLRGQLPLTSRDARRVAKAISRELKRP
jgi:cation diffusion facilitator CzcD-associated flavoprotein CzcO